MIRIIFLCGSLEPGSDGVGDYTRQLAAELHRTGNQASIISLNDRFVSRTVEEMQITEQSAVKTLRLPAEQSWKERLLSAKQWINAENPEWLSLQYVPFSFHPKGLAFQLPGFLKKLGEGKKWHIMFHELWVGTQRGASLKFRVWGFLQKMQVKKLIGSLNPKLIHTHSQTYQSFLGKIQPGCMRLPLFSNIINTSSENVSRNENEFAMVIFGTIHPGDSVEEFADEVKKYGQKKGKEIVLNFVGRSGNNKIGWEKAFNERGMKVVNFGELPPAKVSQLLSVCDLGITTTPFPLIEKSGSVAAMWLHSLKIVCVSTSWKVRGITDNMHFDGLFEYKPKSFESLFEQTTQGPVNDVVSIAAQFLQDIKHKN